MSRSPRRNVSSSTSGVLTVPLPGETRARAVGYGGDKDNKADFVRVCCGDGRMARAADRAHKPKSVAYQRPRYFTTTTTSSVAGAAPSRGPNSGEMSA